VEVIVTDDYDSLSKMAAQFVIDLLNRKPNAVLGLATGSTPVGLYRELVARYCEHKIDFSQVTTFNLDEYVGLSSDHPQSYSHFMRQHLFEHINIPEQAIHVPNGTTTNHEAFCQWYEGEIQRLGGIDVQILGIGSDGHIAFNEPGSSLGSRTRLKTLMEQTVLDNSRFFDDPGDVPRYAITMGVGTILEARHCLLVASGENKAEPIAQAIEGPVTSLVTASALQLHRDVTVVLDEAAASQLQLRDYYRWVHENKPVPGDPDWHRKAETQAEKSRRPRVDER
jgi:glucosamine-6-phosphate deaminase